LGQLRKYLTPEQLIGSLAHTAGLLERYEPISARELAAEFSWEKLKKDDIYLNAEELLR
jgi:glutamyl-tRNA synthetase